MFRFGRRLYLARRILWHWLPRYLAAWALLLFAGYHFTVAAWDYFKSPLFDCGTDGHITVDFGGQWVEGRLLATGGMSAWLGWDTGLRRQRGAGVRLVLAAQDPLAVAALAAAGREHVWDDAAVANASKRRVGGQVYPPIQAFLYAPLGLLPPVE